MAVLDDSQMSELEALETISAIASWVRTEPAASGRACRDTIHHIHNLTVGGDIDGLDDAQVHVQFRRVLAAIRGIDDVASDAPDPD